jgi:excisionase family DNA binding protein
MQENLRDSRYTRLLNVREVCELLRVSRPTVYRLIAGGDLPIVKVGDRTLFRLPDVERFIAGSVRKKT